jgi:uncharacterized glyoxalase superfamily protein PhnB
MHAKPAMTVQPKLPATIVPTLRYRNAPAAMEFLCNAFGFEKKLVVSGEGGTIVDAQLTFGNGIIMLSSDRGSEFGRLMVHPDETGGAETQCAYVIVAQIDAHYLKAKAAGAEILIAIADHDYGGRVYTCRDPEGRIWNFGSYDPWQGDARTSDATGDRHDEQSEADTGRPS